MFSSKSFKVCFSHLNPNISGIYLVYKVRQGSSFIFSILLTLSYFKYHFFSYSLDFFLCMSLITKWFMLIKFLIKLLSYMKFLGSNHVVYFVPNSISWKTVARQFVILERVLIFIRTLFYCALFYYLLQISVSLINERLTSILRWTILLAPFFQ